MKIEKIGKMDVAVSMGHVFGTVRCVEEVLHLGP